MNRAIGFVREVGLIGVFVLFRALVSAKIMVSMRCVRFGLLALALLAAAPVVAQDTGDEDQGFLTRKIQELLSGAGREVRITGFEGALSSSASFRQMTIADSAGVWLTLEDVVLDWNRAALLRGRLEVRELSAARIDIPRLPIAEPDTLPDAQAKPFTFPTLPDLPVSVNIDAITIAQARLGAPLVGQAVQVGLTARAVLDDAGLDVSLAARRTDGTRGTFDLNATLARGEDVLDAVLALSEQSGGIAAGLLNIPDTPSVDLVVAAKGPLTGLVTDLKIDTDGQERLAGQITVITEGQAANPDRRIVADIGGDITAVILPRYRDFFGPAVRLKADAFIEAAGAFALDSFTLDAAAVQLSGRLRLSDEGWPAFIDVQGRVARADGGAVLLPGGGGDIAVGQVVLDVQYDGADGDAYAARFDITDLKTAQAEVAQSTLRSSGTLRVDGNTLGALRGIVQFDALGVALADAALAQAVGDRIKGTATVDVVDGVPFRITDLDLRGSDYSLKGNIALGSLSDGLETVLDAMLKADDLSRFSALAGRELDGATSLAVEGRITPLSGAFDLTAAGTADGISTGIVQADALLAGRTDLSLRAIRNANGTFLRGLELSNAAVALTGGAELYPGSNRLDAQIVLRDIATVAPQYQGAVLLTAGAVQTGTQGWRVDVAANGPYEVSLALNGVTTGPDAALDFRARVPEIAQFTPTARGPLDAQGSLRQTAQGWMLETDASGPFNATARLNGALSPALDLGFDVALPQVSAVVPQVRGPLRATGRLRQTAAGFVIDTEARGPYGLRAQVSGLATGPDMALEFDVALPNVAPLAPGVTGPLRAQGTLGQTPAGLAVQTDATGPYSSRASLGGVVTGPDAQIDFTLALPNLAALVPKLTGPLSARGTAAKTPQGWQIDAAAQGPSGTQAQVAGAVGNGGILDLTINGNAPLGLSAPFIAPRSLQGQARFDLALNGPAALGALTGRIQTTDATLSAPNLRIGLERITADITLANSRAALDVTANATGGGQLAITGGIGLGGGLPADLDIRLGDVVLVDPRLYRTLLSGAVRLSGLLSGGAGISGDITIGETNVKVPSTGLTSIGDIPPIAHQGAPADSVATRLRAGLLEDGAASDPVQNGTGSAGFGLDINVNAPGRIFVRGRGLDAELAGRLRLTGDTTNIISAGRFELARGRLDILGKRFDLEEGTAQFQGSLVPYIRFVSTTTTANGTASVIVEGPADAPEVTFESTPAGPQDEVLAQLLFGRNLSEISAFQALQLANAVATLAGRGGSGVVGNLRDRFGLDDLDVTTTDSGETALRVGKYLTDNVYTDVTAASDGTGEVSLNIDLTPSLKGKAMLGSDGNSSVGLFFEKDY